MTETDDIALLRQWREGRSEAAFRTLVKRFAPLVWGAVLRKLNDRTLAEEAVQQVFIDLAARSPVLVALRRPLAPWLHRAAVYEAVQILRREIRHRDRMKNYADLASDVPQPPDPWEEVRPHLDEAINALGEADRRVLLLHWFERRTFAEVAAQLDCTPAAAQRRGLRALEKLAASLKKRGAVAAMPMLAAGLFAQLSPTVPAAVFNNISVAAISAAASASGTVLSLHQTVHAMASAKLTTAAIIILSAALPVGLQFASSKNRGETPASSAAAFPAQFPSARPGDRHPSAALDLSLIQKAVNRLLENAEDYQTQLELRRLMFSLTAEEIPEVQKLLFKVSGKKKEALYEVVLALFARWAELDPAAATQAAFVTPKSTYGYYPIRGAFITWASADLDAAWTWLEKSASSAMDREFLGGEALATIAADENNREVLISNDSDGLPLDQSKSSRIMARVDKMTDPVWRDQLRFWVMRSWVNNRAVGKAIAWAAQLPEDDGQRGTWLAKAIEQGRALNELHRIENPDRRAEVAHNILWPRLLTQPASAFAELKPHTEDWPADLFRDAGDALTRHNSTKALEAARQLPEGLARDEFVKGMMTGITYSDAAAMLPALGMLSEEALIRSGGFSNFTDQFARQNPQAAALWINSLPASSHVRNWADSHFKSISGRSAADFLTSFPQ